MKIFGNVVLDHDSFKALASEIRIEILKNLDRKQMTVSDLSRQLAVSKSTVHKHLERLTEVGLITKLEDERKWVYYRITRKGTKILHPENVKVSVLLSWTVFLLGLVLVTVAVYLAWFPIPTMPLKGTEMLVALLAGAALLLTGGNLVLKMIK